MATNNTWSSRNPAQVAKGCTGRSQFNESDQLIVSGTNPTNPLQQIPVGNLDDVLTCGGPNIIPSWQPGITPAEQVSFAAYLPNNQFPFGYNNYDIGSGGYGEEAFWNVILLRGFSHSIARFIPPVDGIYSLTGTIGLKSLAPGLPLISASLFMGVAAAFLPVVRMRNSSSYDPISQILYMSTTWLTGMAAGHQLSLGIHVTAASSNNVAILGGATETSNPVYTTYFAGYLVTAV